MGAGPAEGGGSRQGQQREADRRRRLQTVTQPGVVPTPLPPPTTALDTVLRGTMALGNGQSENQKTHWDPPQSGGGCCPGGMTTESCPRSQTGHSRLAPGQNPAIAGRLPHWYPPPPPHTHTSTHSLTCPPPSLRTPPPLLSSVQLLHLPMVRLLAGVAVAEGVFPEHTVTASHVAISATAHGAALEVWDSVAKTLRRARWCPPPTPGPGGAVASPAPPPARRMLPEAPRRSPRKDSRGASARQWRRLQKRFQQPGSVDQNVHPAERAIQVYTPLPPGVPAAGTPRGVPAAGTPRSRLPAVAQQ